jgi:hypothetical protein
MFYAFLVIIYTVDDFKKGYPIYLVVFGLVMHFLAFVTWRDHKRKRSFFRQSRQLIYRILPLGLCVLYLTSILVGVDGGEITMSNAYNVVFFLLTAVPMIMFYISLGFGRHYFPLLRQRKQGINIIYLALVVLMLVGQRFINGV